MYSLPFKTQAPSVPVGLDQMIESKTQFDQKTVRSQTEEISSSLIPMNAGQLQILDIEKVLGKRLNSGWTNEEQYDLKEAQALKQQKIN